MTKIDHIQQMWILMDQKQFHRFCPSIVKNKFKYYYRHLSIHINRRSDLCFRRQEAITRDEQKKTKQFNTLFYGNLDLGRNL